MFSFQGTWLNLKDSMKPHVSMGFQSIFTIHFAFCILHFRSGGPRTRFPRSWLLFNPLAKWWAKMDSNHRPHDYQSCALASWAIGPYPALLWWRVPGSNRWPPACKAGALPAELTPHKGFRGILLGTFFTVPSKLNNVIHFLTLCTDLRTLLEKNSLLQKSP